MNAARWERINAICFRIAIGSRGPAGLVLDQSCVEDAELRAQVGRLLAADDSQRSERDHGEEGMSCKPDEPSFGGGALSAGRRGQNTSRRIGCYTLHGLIGKGGTSEVYLATRGDGEGSSANAKGVGEFALKLIDGNLATEDILRPLASRIFWRRSTIPTSRSTWTRE